MLCSRPGYGDSDSCVFRHSAVKTALLGHHKGILKYSIGSLIMTYIILGAPLYIYSIMGPKLVL